MSSLREASDGMVEQARVVGDATIEGGGSLFPRRGVLQPQGRDRSVTILGCSLVTNPHPRGVWIDRGSLPAGTLCLYLVAISVYMQ